MVLSARMRQYQYESMKPRSSGLLAMSAFTSFGMDSVFNSKSSGSTRHQWRYPRLAWSWHGAAAGRACLSSGLLEASEDAFKAPPKARRAKPNIRAHTWVDPGRCVETLNP